MYYTNGSSFKMIVCKQEIQGMRVLCKSDPGHECCQSVAMICCFVESQSSNGACHFKIRNIFTQQQDYCQRFGETFDPAYEL